MVWSSSRLRRSIFTLLLLIPAPALGAAPEQADKEETTDFSNQEELMLGAFVERLLQMELEFGLKLPSQVIETPNLEIPEDAEREIVIPLPGGRKIIITRDPATGRIRIKIWFPELLMPSINYFIVCDENGCVLKHNLGAELCRFEEVNGTIRLRCDTTIGGLKLDCLVVEIPDWMAEGGLICAYCTKFKKKSEDGEWVEPVPVNEWLCSPIDEVNQLWRQIPDLLRPVLPLIPAWLPILPRLFPSLFPPELFPPPPV